MSPFSSVWVVARTRRHFPPAVHGVACQHFIHEKRIGCAIEGIVTTRACCCKSSHASDILVKKILTGHPVDWSVTPLYINRLHLWSHNKRANCRRALFFHTLYFIPKVSESDINTYTGQSVTYGTYQSRD